MRVLLVEASLVCQRIAEHQFGGLAEIVPVGSTLDAVEMCQDFDLIILDIITPTCNGWHAAEEFAKRCGRPTLVWSSTPELAED